MSRKMTRKQKLQYFGLQVAYWRERRALSQEELAIVVKVGRHTIIRIEAGLGCGIKTMFDISEALEVPASLLVEKDIE